MTTNIALTNISFNFLRGSHQFLELILDNINSSVLLLNNRMELISFNNAFLAMFPKNKDKDLIYIRCGEAIGCAYQVEEQKDCGKTSKCRNCELRLSAISTYLNNTTTFRKKSPAHFMLSVTKRWT